MCLASETPNRDGLRMFLQSMKVTTISDLQCLNSDRARVVFLTAACPHPKSFTFTSGGTWTCARARKCEACSQRAQVETLETRHYGIPQNPPTNHQATGVLNSLVLLQLHRT